MSHHENAYFVDTQLIACHAIHPPYPCIPHHSYAHTPDTAHSPVAAPAEAPAQHLPKHLRSTCRRICAAPADAFALADVSGIRIAAGVRNIGGKIKSSEGSSFSLPASVSAGVAYRFVNTEQHHIEAGADADIFIDGGASASVGVEYSYRNAAFARLGYNYASDKAPVPSFASVGIGFRIRSVRIDASYILPEKESPQKNTFSAGVGIWF